MSMLDEIAQAAAATGQHSNAMGDLLLQTEPNAASREVNTDRQRTTDQAIFRSEWV